MLARVAMPYRFYPHDSQAGRQLLREAGQDGSRLPVVIFRTGQVLVDPSHAELTEFLGASIRPAATCYDVAIVGAAGDVRHRSISASPRPSGKAPSPSSSPTNTSPNRPNEQGRDRGQCWQGRDARRMHARCLTTCQLYCASTRALPATRRLALDGR